MTQPHPTLPDESEPPGGGAQEPIVGCFLKAHRLSSPTLRPGVGTGEWELSMAHPSSLPSGDFSCCLLSTVWCFQTVSHVSGLEL